LSPSARKSQAEHAIHNDYHDFPALQKETSSHSQVSEAEQEETKSAEIMTDDEGTPADVAASIALSEVRAYTLFFLAWWSVCMLIEFFGGRRVMCLKIPNQ